MVGGHSPDVRARHPRRYPPQPAGRCPVFWARPSNTCCCPSGWWATNTASRDFQVVINGATGQVAGEYPKSWVKIGAGGAGRGLVGHGLAVAGGALTRRRLFRSGALSWLQRARSSAQWSLLGQRRGWSRPRSAHRPLLSHPRCRAACMSTTWARPAAPARQWRGTPRSRRTWRGAGDSTTLRPGFSSPATVPAMAWSRAIWMRTMPGTCDSGSSRSGSAESRCCLPGTGRRPGVGPWRCRCIAPRHRPRGRLPPDHGHVGPHRQPSPAGRSGPGPGFAVPAQAFLHQGFGGLRGRPRVSRPCSAISSTTAASSPLRRQLRYLGCCRAWWASASCCSPSRRRRGRQAVQRVVSAWARDAKLQAALRAQRSRTARQPIDSPHVAILPGRPSDSASTVHAEILRGLPSGAEPSIFPCWSVLSCSLRPGGACCLTLADGLARCPAPACALHTPIPWMIGPLVVVSLVSMVGVPTESWTPLRNTGPVGDRHGAGACISRPRWAP